MNRNISRVFKAHVQKYTSPESSHRDGYAQHYLKGFIAINIVCQCFVRSAIYMYMYIASSNAVVGCDVHWSLLRIA